MGRQVFPRKPLENRCSCVNLLREAGDVHRKEQSLPVKRDRQKKTNGIHLTADGIPDLPRSTGVKETAKFYICSLLDLKVSQGTFSFVALQILTTP